MVGSKSIFRGRLSRRVLDYRYSLWWWVGWQYGCLQELVDSGIVKSPNRDDLAEWGPFKFGHILPKDAEECFSLGVNINWVMKEAKKSRGIVRWRIVLSRSEYPVCYCKLRQSQLMDENIELRSIWIEESLRVGIYVRRSLKGSLPESRTTPPPQHSQTLHENWNLSPKYRLLRHVCETVDSPLDTEFTTQEAQVRGRATTALSNGITNDMWLETRFQAAASLELDDYGCLLLKNFVAREWLTLEGM